MNTMTDQPEQIAMLFNNHELAIRIMEYLGPRHVCIGIGSTCHHLRQLSKSDSLWKIFWSVRCGGDPTKLNGDTGINMIHRAAFSFRCATFDMGLLDIFEQSSTKKEQQASIKVVDKEDEDTSKSKDNNTLYLAYIQQHTSMKLANLRAERRSNVYVLKPRLCSQTWPGQLSLVADNEQNTSITCLNPAEAWCDYSQCTHARCGPQGCLRCYRFLPRDYALGVAGLCSERNYDMLSFVKCSWCSVSFCSEHVGTRKGYFEQRGKTWYTCDECQLSSCPDCVSQVFHSPTDMNGCGVVTAGKSCRRKICKQCKWYVGKQKAQSIAMNIPGGDYTHPSETVTTTKGSDTSKQGENEIEWEEVETCCSKCLRHVEFRVKELQQMQESFGGLMP